LFSETFTVSNVTKMLQKVTNGYRKIFVLGYFYSYRCYKKVTNESEKEFCFNLNSYKCYNKKLHMDSKKNCFRKLLNF
jgi:hypothetical protein